MAEARTGLGDMGSLPAATRLGSHSLKSARAGWLRWTPRWCAEMSAGKVGTATPMGMGNMGQLLCGCCSRQGRDGIQFARERTWATLRSVRMSGGKKSPSCLETLALKLKDGRAMRDGSLDACA